MANKIVQIMKYNGSGNDNLIPQLAQEADTAVNAQNAQNAVIGQYASSNTSKGTIDQRLTFLEGSKSSMTLSGISALTTKNEVIRSGNYCVFNLTLTSVSSLYVQLTYTQIGTIPAQYRPKAYFEGWAAVRKGNNYDYVIVGINANDGAVSISSASVGYVSEIHFTLGYEAQSI